VETCIRIMLYGYFI